jgi:Mn-containing catalase
MFLHRKELIQPVNVGAPDPRFGTYLLEQFGGATGELTAALQYWVQSFHVENAGIRDMLQDIAIEEFSHLEMVGKLIAQHTSKLDQTSNTTPRYSRSRAAVRTSWIVREAAGRPPTFKRAAMSSGICGRISPPKPGRVRRTSHLSKRATTRAQRRPYITS